MKEIFEDVFDSLLIIAFGCVIIWAIAHYLNVGTYKRAYSHAVQSTSFKNVCK